MTMANTRGFSRRTFLLGMAAGAASMSMVWRVSELRLPFLGSGYESAVTATRDTLVEYDGWLLTAEEKARLVLVEFADGWHNTETAGGSSWRWTRQVATLAFPNPRTGVVLDLDYNAPANLFRESPRTLTISVGDRVLRTVALDSHGRRQINVLLPAPMFGRQDRAEVRIAVDRTIVPANLNPDSRDTRELGIQVYRAVIERSADGTAR